jgi:2-polyprenyl-6-methoxyphenol hydroxylase-like FAD-dependent oxidoreductase
VILPLEGNRWHITLIGIAGDYPPTDEAGFLEFARSLASPEIYEAIRSAEPLSRIAGYRKNENRVRRFENLPRYLEGLLVLGDAVYTTNPVYALGMTAALVSSQVLDQVVQKMHTNPSPEGLSAAFQKKLAASLKNLWQLAVRSDWRWPATDISDNTEELYLQAV